MSYDRHDAMDRHAAMEKVLTVADLIRVLATYPADLPIYLADWNEEYMEDWPLVVDAIRVLDRQSVHDRGKNLLFEQPQRLCLGSVERKR